MARLAGRAQLRLEDVEFLTGAATYVADVDHPSLAGMASVVFVRSTVAHGLIEDVDISEAIAAAGVIDVVTAGDVDVPGRIPGFLMVNEPIFDQPLLADKKVRYVGEPIVAVVAETLAAAVEAAELVVVDYRQLQPVLDLDEARSGRALLFEPGVHPTSVAPNGNELGHVAVGPTRFPECPVVIEETIWNPRQSPAPIEGRGVAAAWTADGHLHVWAATQRAHGFRDQLAQLYDLDPGQVHVVAGPRVGGGFGGKVSRSVEEHLLPLLAGRTGRAVRWTDTRSEYQASATHARGERITIRIGGGTDGRIAALEISMVKDLGAYPGVGTHLPTTYAQRMANGPYDIAHVRFESVGVMTNRVATSAFRGAGRAALIAALERAIDIYSTRIGLDSAVVRRRNLVPPDQMPYVSPGGGVYDEADYIADLDRALAAVGYPALRTEQAQRRSTGDPVQIGVGIGCYNMLTIGAAGGEEARVSIRRDGSALVVTGATSQGQGHSTTWAQLAGETLGLPIDRIEVVEGDSDAIASGVGAVGSRSLQTAGIAVITAAEKVAERARLLAAAELEAAPVDVVLDREHGAFHVGGTPARMLTWAELAAMDLDEEHELRGGATHDATGRLTFPSGTHVAAVEVDTETGYVELVRFVAVDDTGVRVNPMIVEGQLHGGIAAGISQVLGEEVVYDLDGNLLTSNFGDYPIISADRLPAFDLIAAEVSTSFNDHGFKAVGESGVMGATPAVHNAVIDALTPFGLVHIDMPCTPRRVWEALERCPKRPDSSRAGGRR